MWRRRITGNCEHGVSGVWGEGVWALLSSPPLPLHPYLLFPPFFLMLAT